MTDTAFVNRPIAPASLPDYRQVILSPVAASYLPYAVLTTAFWWLLLIVVSLTVPYLPRIGFDPGWWPPLVLGLAGIWFVLIAVLDARRRGWAVREHDLIYRSGVIWRKTVILPFARIQHVETASGPIERLFGLRRVKCFTAGGISADLSILGLDVDSARRVRQYLLEQIREDGSVDDGDAAAVNIGQAPEAAADEDRDRDSEAQEGQLVDRQGKNLDEQRSD